MYKIIQIILHKPFDLEQLDCQLLDAAHEYLLLTPQPAIQGQHPAVHTGNIYMNTHGQLQTRHYFFTATTPMFQLFGRALRHSVWWTMMRWWMPLRHGWTPLKRSKHFHTGNIHIPAIRPIVILSSTTDLSQAINTHPVRFVIIRSVPMTFLVLVLPL